MTKLSFALLLASALSLGALSAAPAGADTRAGAASSTFAARRDTPHCVTKREWRRVYIVPDGTGRGPGKGGTKARVHRIFDVRGKRTWCFNDGHGTRHQTRSYNRCARKSRYKVTYIKYRSRPWWSYGG